MNILHEGLHIFITTLVNNFTMITLVTRLPVFPCFLWLIQWLNFPMILWLLCLPRLTVLPAFLACYVKANTPEISHTVHFLSCFRLSPCFKESHSTKHQNWLAFIISTPWKICCIIATKELPKIRNTALWEAVSLTGGTLSLVHKCFSPTLVLFKVYLHIHARMRISPSMTIFADRSGY
jgi:hypothetical protein